MEIVGSEQWSLLDLCRHARRGHLPVSGGVLDQTAWFMSMYDIVETERSYYMPEWGEE